MFIIQLCNLIPEYVNPTELNLTMKKVNLNELEEFPLVFKFCIRPGWNMTRLNEHGYLDIDRYFWGWIDSMYEDPYYDVGWDGKDANVSPAGG